MATSRLARARLWAGRAALALALGMSLLLAGLAVYVWRSFPVLDGRARSPGLTAPVTVARDASDVTHISAANARDAWHALGYTHAQERGWQLAFNRRLARGELSELFGPETLETDRLMRTLGIQRAAREQWMGLPPDAQAALLAYAGGIQAFFETSSQALPPEFHLTRSSPFDARGRAWDAVDSVAWALLMALDLGGNWSLELARLASAEVLDNRRLWQLYPPYPGEVPATRVDLPALYKRLGVYPPRADAQKSAPGEASKGMAMRDMATDGPFASGNRASDDLLRGLTEPDGKGSNNWAIGPSRSARGKPLLANDPHLGLTAPAVWYFARLQAPAARVQGLALPALDVIGATLPGLPFVVLGRGARLAWSFTNTAPDTQDLYLEQINPADASQYRVPAPGAAPSWSTFEERRETIRVKGQAPVEITVRSTRHGPVVSDHYAPARDAIDRGRYALALRFAALEADNRTVLAGLRGNGADNADELVARFADYHSPMQNLLVADVDGRLRYKAAGRVPLRASGDDVRGVAPVPGWEARYDWVGWLPYARTPQNDGAAGFIATANQRITPPGYPHFMGQDWKTPERHERIVQMIEATPLHDVDSMADMQADQVSLSTLRLLPLLQHQQSADPLVAQVIGLLRGFDGQMSADSPQALVFAVWADEITRALVEPVLGAPRFARQYGRRQFRDFLENTLQADERFWCGPGGCDAQVARALERAVRRIAATEGEDPRRWAWGRWHPAISSHRPMSQVAALAGLFELRVPVGGDAYTVNVGQYWLDQPRLPFAARHGPSMRAIYDLADLENSRFIYPTGQSGLVFSSRYGDMSQAWAEGDYRELKLAPAHWAHRLLLEPGLP